MKLTKEQIKDELRDKLYCVVDPDGDEIVTLEQAAEELLAQHEELERLREVIKSAVSVFRQYEEDVGDYPTLEHRAFMETLKEQSK